MVSWKHLNFILFASVIALISVVWISYNYNNRQDSYFVPQPIKIKQRKIINNPVLMDFHGFNYTINNDICLNNDLFLIIIIHSAPFNLKKRDIIRTSWGMPKNICGKKMRLVFLLSKVEFSFEQDSISKENSMYGDIIQGNFKDSYRNLTYKNIMGLKWVSEYCPDVNFVLKTDDDIYLDIFKLFDLLLTDFRNKTTEFIACNEWEGMGIIREPMSKWYVSEEQVPGDVYSPYCSGWAYILTPDVATKIYEISAQFNYLFLDDVLVTGPMVDRAGYVRTQLNDLYTFGNEKMFDWIAESEFTTPCKYMVGWYNEDFNLAMKLWSKTVLSWTPLMKELCVKTSLK